MFLERFFIKLILFIFFISTQGFSSYECHRFFNVASESDVNIIRHELLERNANYTHPDFPLSRISLFRGKDEVFDISYQPESVISFGSGPDVFTPLILFPKIKSLHLVDMLNGWGDGPYSVLRETLNRLYHLFPKARIQIKDLGFLALENGDSSIKLLVPFYDISKVGGGIIRTHFAQFSLQYWNYWGWPDLSKYKPQTRLPLKIEVETPHRVLKVYIHHADFDNRTHMNELKKYFVAPQNPTTQHKRSVSRRRIHPERLGGIILTGMTPPKFFFEFLNLTESQGYLYYEYYRDDDLNQSFLSQLLQKGRFVRTLSSDENDHIILFQKN